jgi:hypothetical protein
MHKLIELVATGAFYTAAPLLLLLAVDLVCWSIPIVFKGMAAGFPRMQWAHVKRDPGNAPSSHILN